MPKLGMKEFRKDQVTEATMRCIIRKGLSNLSVKEIAAEAGLSTGIIYHYFDNKDDLLLQVLKKSFQKSDEKVRNNIDSIQSPKDKLSHHIDSINRMPIENPEFMVVFLNYLGEANYNPNIRQIVNRFFKSFQSYIIEYLHDEDTDPNQLNDLTVILSALGVGLGMMWTLNNESFDIEEISASIKKLVMPLLGSR